MDERRIVEIRPGPANIGSLQLSLFPRTVLDALQSGGADLTEAQRLRDRGLLSFEPEPTKELTSEQEAELDFLLGLVGAGCDAPVLVRLLASLDAPYAFDTASSLYSVRSHDPSPA